jgi:hypothetical protein
MPGTPRKNADGSAQFIGLPLEDDPERQEVFLRAYAQSGSYAWAAFQATPHAKSARSARQSFIALEHRDPIFAERVEDARSEAQAMLEKRCHDLALHGEKRISYHRDGSIAAEETRTDSRILLRALSRINPEWSEHTHKTIEHRGDRLERTVMVANITAADILLLGDEESIRACANYLNRIRREKLRLEEKHAALPMHSAPQPTYAEMQALDGSPRKLLPPPPA